MHIYTANLLSGVQQPPIRLRAWKRRIELGIHDTKGRKEPEDEVIAKVRARRSGLEMIRHGNDVTVTNYGLIGGVFINKQPLAYGVKYAWLEHQDLQIGKHHLLHWEADPPATLPGYRWQLVWGALLLLLLLPFWMIAIDWVKLSAASAAGAVGANLLPVEATLPPSQTPAPTTTPPNTPEPTAAIALPTRQLFPTRAVPLVAIADADSVTLTQMLRESAALATATALSAAAAAAATPAPCTPAPSGQVNWDPAISMWVEPACVRPGDKYWRLVEAKWLSDEIFNGYQHLFVDVKDQNMARITGATFVMSWPDGRCKLSIGQGIAEPIEHGNNCPMFSPAESYEVRVEGLPSDVVRGLGLGAVHPMNRPVEYMTSFYLLFQLSTYEGG